MKTSTLATSDAVKPTTRDVELTVARRLRHVREAFERSIAVVLGVNAYGHGIPRLRTAVPDAEAVGALLETEHGFTTVLRRDAEGTADRVRALLEHELGDLGAVRSPSAIACWSTLPATACRCRASMAPRASCCLPTPT